MAKRTIEETFQAVKPKGRKGIPNPPTIAVGAASNNSDLGTSLSQAGQQIAQLQSAYQQQASLISANTQAIQGNTLRHSRARVLWRARPRVPLPVFFGGLGLLSPINFGHCRFVRGEFEAGAASDFHDAAHRRLPSAGR